MMTPRAWSSAAASPSQLGNGLAFIDRLREAEMRRAQQAVDIDTGIEARRMVSKDFGRPNGEG